MLFSIRLLTNGLALGAALLVGSASAQPADVVRARQLLAEARTVAEKVKERGSRLRMLAEVAGAQARAGDRQAALASAATVVSISWGWTEAAKGFADAGDLDAALDAAGKIVSDDMFSAGLKVNLERDDTLREIALRRAQRRDVKGAIRAIHEIGFAPIAARAYAALAEAQARAGDVAEARRTLALAESAAGKALPHPIGTIFQYPAYGDIGKVYWRVGDRTAAVAAFDKGLAAARATPDGTRDCALAFNAADRAEAGDVAGALRVLQEVSEPRRMPTAAEIARVGRGLAEAGQHDRALDLTRMASDDPRVNAGPLLGEVYLRKGDAARAAWIFERVIAAAEKSFPELAQEVVRVQAQNGDPAGALRSTARLVQPGGGIKNEMSNDYIYGALATGQAEAGDPEAAWRTIALVKGYPPQPETWRALGRLEGRRGNVDAVLARAPSPERRRVAFLIGLAEGLVDRAEGRQP